MSNASPALIAAMQNDPGLAPIFAGLGSGDAAALAGAIANFAVRKRQVIPQVDAGPTGQRFRLWNNYYSVVRFQAIVSVVPPTTTLTFQQQQLRPFGYRIGDNLQQAGFDPTFGLATEADTNLVKAGETIAGEQLEVDGISLMPSPISDVGVYKQLIANMSVVISMDGDAHRYRLGRPDMIPGSGGTFGGGVTPTLVPDLLSSQAVDTSFSNGWPVVDNFYPFPQPLIWTPSGETDSTFNVVLSLVRQQVFVETARAGTDAIAPYTPPTVAGQFGTFIDIMVRLHSEQRAARSVNQ
jgi:hypothetical protein